MNPIAQIIIDTLYNKQNIIDVLQKFNKKDRKEILNEFKSDILEDEEFFCDYDDECCEGIFSICKKCLEYMCRDHSEYHCRNCIHTICDKCKDYMVKCSNCKIMNICQECINESSCINCNEKYCRECWEDIINSYKLDECKCENKKYKRINK